MVEAVSGQVTEPLWKRLRQGVSRFLSTPSLFFAPRKMYRDLILFTVALISPRLFTLILVFFFRQYVVHLGLSRKALLKKLLTTSFRSSGPPEEFREAWLICGNPHMRERTMLKAFGHKIKRAYSMGDKEQQIFEPYN